MCPDNTAHGRGIDSQVIWSERAHAPRREVLTFPIKASGRDKPTLTATIRCGTQSGERSQSRQEAEAEVRKLLCSLRGASNHLGCWVWSHYCWMWVTLPGYHCALSPQAFIWSQGIWILYGLPRALESYTVSKSLILCTYEDNINTDCLLQCIYVYFSKKVSESPESKLAARH